MPLVVATGAFCPVDALVEALGASGWQVVPPDRFDETALEMGPFVGIVDDDLGQLAELLTAHPAAQAVVLHATREEALAFALCEGIEPAAALERWQVSALEQVALFRRMRRRVALVSRQRFEAAPEVFLGDGASGMTLPSWRADPLALLLAKEMIAAMAINADTAASMLVACMREEDRGSPTLDIEYTLAAWQQCEESRQAAEAERKALEAAQADLRAMRATLAAREQALKQAKECITALEADLRTAQDTIVPETSAELERLRQIEASQGEEISLLREHLAQLQSALEETWLRKDEITATASRQPPVHEGLTVTVDLGTTSSPL
jgi:hypothetical protein